MNTRKSVWVTGLAMMLTALVGCSATAYRISHAPSAKNVSAQTIDSLQCNEESRITPVVRVLFCGVGAPICRDVDDSRYEQCMRAKGYQVSPMS